MAVVRSWAPSVVWLWKALVRRAHLSVPVSTPSHSSRRFPAGRLQAAATLPESSCTWSEYNCDDFHDDPDDDDFWYNNWIRTIDNKSPLPYQESSADPCYCWTKTPRLRWLEATLWRAFKGGWLWYICWDIACWEAISIESSCYSHLAIGWVGSLAAGCWALIEFGPGGPGGCCLTELQKEKYGLFQAKSI